MRRRPRLHASHFLRFKVAAHRPLQPEMFAQCASVLLAAENAAFLQKRHHAVDKVPQATRQDIRYQAETIRGGAFDS